MPITLAVVALLASGALAGPAPTRDELAIHYSGPVTISPWRAAIDAQQQTSVSTQQWNHYCFSPPPPFIYCGWGYGCYLPWYGSRFSYYNLGYYHVARFGYGFHHDPDGRYVP